jgi:hypothetical protein
MIPKLKNIYNAFSKHAKKNLIVYQMKGSRNSLFSFFSGGGNSAKGEISNKFQKKNSY